MTVDVKIDTSAFDRALARFGVESKKSSVEVLNGQAKLFVRDIVRITPPSMGKTSIKKGKARVVSDVLRVVRSVRAPTKADSPEDNRLASLAEIERWHQSKRNRRGRVPKRVAKADVATAPAGLIKTYIAAQVAKVGILASGWNSAATRLGLQLPTWITRHGTARGQVDVITSGGTVKIRITNAVRYVGDVRGMDRRVQSALNNRAKQMDKQVDDLAVKRASRAAGFK